MSQTFFTLQIYCLKQMGHTRKQAWRAPLYLNSETGDIIAMFHTQMLHVLDYYALVIRQSSDSADHLFTRI